MTKGAIFDLDGTLLFTLEDLKDSMNFALKKYNFPERTLDEIRDFVGNGVKVLAEKAIPQGSQNSEFTGCLETFKQHYAKNMYNKTKPFEGIYDTLSKLKLRGYKMAVVSNKFDSAVKELCEKYFKNYIDIAIGENEQFGINKKPAPDSILKAMEILQCNPDLTYYIGDSEVDIETAKNSNLKCISVTWGYKNKEFLINHNAKILVDKPWELLEILT